MPAVKLKLVDINATTEKPSPSNDALSTLGGIKECL